MAALVWATSALLLTLLSPHFALAYNTTTDLHAVLVAIEKLVVYYQNSYMHLNLDGFFGLRLIEGQFQLLLDEHEGGRHQHVLPEVISKLNNLKDTAHKVSVQALEFIQKDDDQYFKEFSPVINTPWRLMKPHRKLKSSLRWEIPQYKAKTKVTLSEEISDKCMIELMSGGLQGCLISEMCARMMTTRGLTGYSITHQLLWSAMAEVMPNCSASVHKTCANQGLGGIEEFQLEFCTNNFYEMVAIVHVLMHGKIHESHQDLFLEEQFVCPNLGFYEFLKKDYLDQILSWQFPSGCFGEREPYPDSAENNAEVNLGSLLEGYHDNKLKFGHSVQQVDHRNASVQKMHIDNKQENFQRVNSIPRASVAYDYVHEVIPQSRAVLREASELGKYTQLKVPKHVVLPKTWNDKEVQKMGTPSDLKGPSVELLHSPATEKIDVLKPVSEQQGKPNGVDVQHVLRNIVPSVQGSNKKSVNSPTSSSQKNHVGDGKSQGQNVRHVGRRLLVEKEMEGGCLSHKTGVASGALVMYLRYLIDPGDIKWTGQHDLFLSDTRNLLEAGKEELDTGGVAYQDDGEDEEEDEEEEEEEYDDGDAEEDNGALAQVGNLNGDNIEYEDEDDEEGDEYDDDDYNNEEDDGIQDGNENKPVIRIGGNHNQEDNNEDFIKETPDAAIKHLPLPPQVANHADGNGDEEEAPNYYDDEGETERGIIRRRKQPTPRPHPPVKTRRKHSGVVMSQDSLYSSGRDVLISDHPNYFIILLVSVAPFFILFFFLFKFIRKRRVHIRYYF